MPAVFTERLDSPFGPISLNFGPDGFLVEIKLRSRRRASAGRRPPGVPSRPALKKWLAAACAGKEVPFPGSWDIPQSSPFFTRVWKEVAGIQSGVTLSYGEVARRSGSPGASRAVGSAMARNPLPFLVPCHRVRATNGLGGFGGGLPMKAALLKAEGAEI